MTIGVVAFQGDFSRHIGVFRELGVDVSPIRKTAELDAVDGLVIPGGESTTIGMLMERYGLLDRVRERALEGLPILGTCAGAILLARDIVGSDQPRVGVMDIGVRRNAYGRQVDSFEASVSVSALGTAPLTGVFIRAPRIESLGRQVSVLASFEDAPVLVRQQQLLALSFHPELTGDLRVHRYFLDMVGEGA